MEVEKQVDVTAYLEKQRAPSAFTGSCALKSSMYLMKHTLGTEEVL